ncbi:lamin tail domain-containing protein [Myxococcus sp. RHSTA-1-4]|uniref:lamin tail domain-containing protein n=1 Tax=Myxococcus sp. RHSTA-1-4 TaxID=2874601 RepID=UPI001CC06866|nr:lamin tail domain-containing protein [Myxococcus sp. RHSTA-1-4]MBZ4421687.1 lamin tail domain-containing protein [Myxococcus sp. RHSTA-1-4]
MSRCAYQVLWAAVLLGFAGLSGPALAQSGAAVLFDAGHLQTAGNADWVLDENTCDVAQRYPSPAQSGITASTPETYWSGAFSSFGVALAKKGFQLESLPPGVPVTYGDASNPQDLANYKVYVIPEPNVRFTTAEKTAIINFVRNGGGLFMISDHWNSDRNNDGWDSPEIFNDLMTGTSWGIHFQVSGETDNWFNDHPDSKFTKDTTSPIIYTGPYGAATAGKGLGLYGATSMTLSPAQNATVRGHVWMTNGTADTNSKVTFATSTDGQGRIAAIGDSSPSEDATNSCGHTTYEGWNVSTFDNALIHLNAVAWLASGGGGTTDTTAPSAPANLTATAASSSQLNLAWTASTDNVGVTDYSVYRSTNSTDFSLVASVTGTSHSDTGLAASTTYWYRVTANDAANNESGTSNTASATTSGATSAARVIINEILANEPGSTTAGEFVELVNVGGASIDLGGWTLSDGTSVRHTFAAGTTLAAGKAVVVFGGASAIPAGLTNAVAASTGSLGLANGGDSVTVKNAAGTAVDTYTYASSLAGTDGVSMNRSPDASATGTFALHTTLSSLTSSAGQRVNGSAF